MRKVLTRVLTWLGHVSAIHWLLQWIAPAAGGLAIAWTLLSKMNATGAILFGIWAFAALALVVNTGTRIFDRWRASSQNVADALSEFRTAGVKLRNKRIGSDTELDEWWSAVDKWRADLEATITRFFGKAKSDSVLVLDRYDPPQDLPPEYNERHRWKRDDLSERLTRLKKLIDESS